MGINDLNEARQELEERRKHINSRIETNVYRLVISRDGDERIYDLIYPPLICYRYFNSGEQSQQQFKQFRNDIALLHIPQSRVEDHGQYNYLRGVTLETLKKAVGKKVFIKERVGEVVHMTQALYNEESVAYHLAFKLLGR